MHTIIAIIIAFSALIICGSTKEVKPSQFRVIMEWKTFNFSWTNAKMYQDALQAQTYIPKNCLIAGINYRNGYYYLTLPRMKAGIPATLTKIPVNGSTSPVLTPYPSWEMNKLSNCSALQNSQNIEIDSKGRMWILDSGRTSTLSMRHNVNLCPPKLVIYDMDNDQIVRTYQFPKNVVDDNKAYLYDIVVNEKDGDDYAYITDNSIKDPGLIVYSFKENSSWKLRHQSMFADPKAADFKVNGVVVSTPINVAGIALGPRMRKDNKSITISEDREVFYCPLSSLHLYSISTSVLNNQSLLNNTAEVKDVGPKGSQTDGMVMDNEGILYYSLLGSNSISMWNTDLPFASAQKVIARDPEHIQWANSLTFDNDGNLVVLGNNLHKYVFDTLNLDEVNFRLLMSHTGTRSYIYADGNFHYNSATTSSDEDSSESDEDDEDDEDESTGKEEDAEDDKSNSERNSTSRTTSSETSSSSGNRTLPVTAKISANRTSTKAEITTNPSNRTLLITTTNSSSNATSSTATGGKSSETSTIGTMRSSMKTANSDSVLVTASENSASETQETARNYTTDASEQHSSSDYSKLTFTVIVLSAMISLCR